MFCSIALAGCGEKTPASADNTVRTEKQKESTELASETSDENETGNDQEASDNVAALIDAIYVQQRTDDTDAQCAQAKAAWDALTDAQKRADRGRKCRSRLFWQGYW